MIRETSHTLFRLAQSNEAKFAIVFLVVNLHTLRDLVPIPYISLYGTVALFVSVQFVRKCFRERESGIDWAKWTPLVVVLTVAVLGTITSLAIISPGGALYGAARFVFALPLLFAFYLYTDSWQTLRRHLVTFVMFFALASLTVPLQLLTGPVSWFAAATERAGLDRFSSLVGSLTALGIVVGCFLVLTQAAHPRLQLALASVIAVSGVMSLSKSAIANIAIAVVILVFLNRRSYVKLLWSALVVLVAGTAIYLAIPPLRDRLDASLESFGIANDSVVNYDTSILDGAISRLVYWPSVNFAALAEIGNPLVYVFGGGFGMADTALVPASDSLATMAHNQFAEAITVFGFFGGGVLIVAMLFILYRLLKLYRTTRRGEVQMVIWAYALFLVNSIFANGTLYQPAVASIFYLGMFLAMYGKSLARVEDPEGNPLLVNTSSQNPRASDRDASGGSRNAL